MWPGSSKPVLGAESAAVARVLHEGQKLVAQLVAQLFAQGILEGILEGIQGLVPRPKQIRAGEQQHP